MCLIACDSQCNMQLTRKQTLHDTKTYTSKEKSLMLRKYLANFVNRWVNPVISVRRLWHTIPLYAQYLSDWKKYSELPNAESLTFLNSHPCLFDRTSNTSFDAHYFYQDVWGFKRIREANPAQHVDVGSHAILIGMLTTITKVLFLDIRPLHIGLDNYEVQPASILDLPFDDGSINSLSCMHVVEHIGLGRYGDPLDPEGTKKAIKELARVLAPGGNLYFTTPVGRPRVNFNAHRVHAPQQIIDWFQDLKLVHFSGVTDAQEFRENISPAELANSEYACGMFHFTK